MRLAHHEPIKCWGQGRHQPGTANDHLRPDLVVTTVEPHVIIHGTIPFDEPDNIKAAHVEKFKQVFVSWHHLPFVVGSLGSLLPSNNIITASLGINPRSWNASRLDTRLPTMKAFLSIARQHIPGQNRPEVAVDTDASPDDAQDQPESLKHTVSRTYNVPLSTHVYYNPFKL